LIKLGLPFEQVFLDCHSMLMQCEMFARGIHDCSITSVELFEL